MVNIDTVYQKVLAFANKEQRGYITPQEFNLFADQAQMEIFEQYFYDIDQYRRRPNNNHAYSDILSNLEEKISHFKRYDENVSSRLNVHGDVRFDNDMVYRLGMLRVRHKANAPLNIAEEMKMEEEFVLYGSSPLTKHSIKRPIYWKRKSNSNETGGQGISIRIYPAPEEHDKAVLVSYIKYPFKPNWGYMVINDKPLYNANTSNHFELHASEESELVYRILAYVGIAIEKPQLTQMAVGLEQTKVQQEKQ